MKWVNLRAVISKAMAAGVLLLVYPVAGAISAELGPIPSGAVACGGNAYTVDPDPKGINVRSAPQKGSPVLFVIPLDDTEVELAASFGDWVLIRAAHGLNSGFESQKKGWVHSSLLAVRAVRGGGLRSVPLHSKPDTGSSVIQMIAGEPEVRVEGCKENWMHVRIGKQVGWLAQGDYCGNPVTTCP
jgi:SH3-like domain-containing protein